MNCPQCGYQNDPNSRNCRKCFAGLEAPKPKPTYSRPCKFCGQPCADKTVERETIFGIMRQTTTYCYHCQSFQV